MSEHRCSKCKGLFWCGYDCNIAFEANDILCSICKLNELKIC